MPHALPHTFHIPVMGLAFSIDSPLRVARFGISAVVSLSDDTLIEEMRAYYSQLYQEPYAEITPDQEDYRARRITGYLNLLDKIVKTQVAELKQQAFTSESELTKYFSLLPGNSPLRQAYKRMQSEADPEKQLQLQQWLREAVVPGRIDVNIMTKLDKTNYGPDGEPLPGIYTDALAALRGFANSTVAAAVVFSAGMNMKLYGYLDQFPDFIADEKGEFKKQVIIKVSDYRSALVQGKILAKKGIWVSEFRIESGLNCGGHAFATDGYLLGPILEEFKQNRESLQQELFGLYAKALTEKGIFLAEKTPEMRITVQGGIGTATEQNFLLNHYPVNATGWGTPFLLVPEATNVDPETVQKLVNARTEDLYLSDISPLGVPFNSLRDTTSESLKLSRIAKGKPGNPCVKKHLVSNTEFTKEAICTASRKFQKNKLAQLETLDLAPEAYAEAFNKIVAKECLCEGLSNTALVNLNIPKKATRQVAICPGPNLAWFSGIFSLQQMADHIYGRTNLLNETYRPHMFINELRMYVQYWQKQQGEQPELLPEKQQKYLETFRQNLLLGIQYYRQLSPEIFGNKTALQYNFEEELQTEENALSGVALKQEAILAL
jgi:hypothetical protein